MKYTKQLYIKSEHFTLTTAKTSKKRFLEKIKNKKTFKNKKT